MDEQLWDWVQTATQGLCHPAVTRITLEIEAHYDEAVAAHIAEGRTEVGARAMVMEELGDAKKAAKSFGRKHLTEKELKYLSNLTQGPEKSRRRALIRCVLLIAIALAVILLDLQNLSSPIANNWFSSNWLLLYVVLTPLSDSIFLLARRSPPKISSLNLFLFQIVRDVAGSALMMLNLTWFWKHWYVFAAMFFLSSTWTVLSHIDTWRKMQNDKLA